MKTVVITGGSRGIGKATAKAFMKFPKLKFSYNQNDSVDIIIHGGSKGIESDFMNKLFNVPQAQTALVHLLLTFLI